ncbi:uncharacterized protein HRG_06573 [Hirsutella rhossiliensis]|uniref:DUF7492 domain-containing protein n=1 Tax=Hirsutella rhossiliensis TaxID=111463 RepID=A0A9P8MY78_9HYPO|nr:uncharacterized protein HRG_06573 [Hirsutella rhossiliensis]KAH0962471.1 hypothetical protein HRG_06573 [Hirsutella rhossiliensis]
MKNAASSRAGLAALLALAASTAMAHSWIESAFVVAPNGTYIGTEGFPRGYVPRTDPGFNDKVAQHQIPEGGVYKGDEVLNKYPFEANPKHPLLLATPGSKVAIRHLENGHVTLPQAQANKPLNRGTVYLYGTTQPKEQEKLFDVHLLWNQDGSGGDKRGRLLATRNYDDGQCFQDNKQAMAQERASKLAADGAKVEKELKCQSAITIPDDAKPGSVYTVYWYWDWPTLNPEKRGDKVPNGWGPDAIVVNESYSSVIDIKIIDSLPGVIAKEGGGEAAWVNKQDIYSQGIKSQMVNSFDVPVDSLGGGSGGGGSDGAVKPSPAPSAPSAPAAPPASPAPGAPSAPAASPAPPAAGAPSAPAASPASPAAAPAAPPASGAPAPPAPTNPAAPAESKAAAPGPQSLPGSSIDTPTPGNTCVPAPPAGAIKPSKAIVTETVTVPPTTVVQTVYVTDSPHRRAKRARAPSTTLATRTRQARIPVGTAITPSKKRDDNAAGPKPSKPVRRN